MAQCHGTAHADTTLPATLCCEQSVLQNGNHSSKYGKHPQTGETNVPWHSYGTALMSFDEFSRAPKLDELA